MNKNTWVNLIFEFPREDHATLKYICTKRGVSIKQFVGDLIRARMKDLIQEEADQQKIDKIE